MYVFAYLYFQHRYQHFRYQNSIYITIFWIYIDIFDIDIHFLVSDIDMLENINAGKNIDSMYRIDIEWISLCLDVSNQYRYVIPTILYDRDGLIHQPIPIIQDGSLVD